MTAVQYRMHLPDDFLQKEVNERCVCELLCRAIPTQQVRRGDPKLREPDYLLDGVGVEVTLATEGKHPPNFLGEYCDGAYGITEAQNAMTMPILAALERKSRKEYRSRPVRVAVLCMLELFGWTGDVFGDTVQDLPYREREAFFSIVRMRYIETGIFSDVLLLVPTLERAWAVFSLEKGDRYLVPLSPSDTDLPYFTRED
jgi:hypothetical protein